MPLRVNAKQLRDLIEEIEANGGDAAVLRRELAALGPDQDSRTHRHGSRFNNEEEPTTAERLNNRVGDLFPNGIPLQEILDYDYRFTLEELRARCRDLRIGISGDKKELAAKLIAHNYAGKSDKPVYLGEGI